MAIKFYTTKGQYGCFSNFSRHSLKYRGDVWMTSEHAFQAQKFLEPELQAKVLAAKTPAIAASIGRDRSLPLRKDWEGVKNDIMREVVYAKFSQNKTIKTILIDTGDEDIIEHTANDSYWADGGNGKGKNMLGKILMETRNKLKEEK